MTKIVLAVVVVIGIVELISFFWPWTKVVTSLTSGDAGSDEPQSWRDMQARTVVYLEVLDGEGDKREKVRTVDHFADFKKEEDAQKFESWVKTIGAKTESIHKNQDDYSVAFTLEHDVKAETIEQLTKKLFDKCLELHGEYDGWGCTVAN